MQGDPYPIPVMFPQEFMQGQRSQAGKAVSTICVCVCVEGGSSRPWSSSRETEDPSCSPRTGTHICTVSTSVGHQPLISHVRSAEL